MAPKAIKRRAVNKVPSFEIGTTTKDGDDDKTQGVLSFSKAATKKKKPSACHDADEEKSSDEEKPNNALQVIKRPAAWHEDSEDEETPTDEPDARKCSRAQQYVFTKCFDELPDAVQKKYNATKNNKTMKGKQVVLNTIVNAAVPRNAKYKSRMVLKECNFTEVLERGNSDSIKTQNIGVSYSEALNEFRNDDAALTAALARNDYYEKGGFYYKKRRIEEHNEFRKECNTGQKQYEVDTKNFATIMANVFEESGFLETDIEQDRDLSKVVTKSVEDPSAMMERLQTAFDATTKLTLECKKLAREISAKGYISDTVQGKMREGLDACRALVNPSNDIEDMLLSDPKAVNIADAVRVLKESGALFRKLLLCQKETIALVRFHNTEAKRVTV
jgi:hypothetical protein